MKRMFLYSLTLAIITIITFAFSAMANDANEINTNFLFSYGWIVDKEPIERVNLILPSYPDDVFTSYNHMQKEAGLNILPYLGKSCTRYTYIVKNYPKNIDEPVRANILVSDGKIIAGDIMTVSLNGFMHSLVFPT